MSLPKSGATILLSSECGYARAGEAYRVTHVGKRELRLENVQRGSATYVRTWELARAGWTAAD